MAKEKKEMFGGIFCPQEKKNGESLSAAQPEAQPEAQPGSEEAPSPVPDNRTDKYRMPTNDDLRENSNIDNSSDPDPEKVEELKKLSVDLTRFLRLYAMDLLQIKGKECTLTLDGKTVPIAQSDSLFDAFVAIDERVERDWSQIAEKTDNLWRETAVQMVLNPHLYHSLWKKITMKVYRDAAFAGMCKGANTPDVRRNYQSFGVLCLSICSSISDKLGNE